MKYDPQINSLIQEIAGLCYQIKCAHGHDVFFSWGPHVKWVQVQFFLGAWERDSRFDWQDLVRVKEAGAVEKLAALRDRLALILSPAEVPA
jgi:hypothetical protein